VLELGFADALAGESEEALAVRFGDPLGEVDDEIAIRLGLLWSGLALDRRDRVAELLEQLPVELLLGRIALEVHFRLGRHDLVEQLTGAVPPAGLRVGLRDREALAEGAAALRGRHDQAGAWRCAEHQIPILCVEVGLCGHEPRGRCAGKRVSPGRRPRTL
jgi:hypothetical protein